jgi:hypothetical protein
MLTLPETIPAPTATTLSGQLRELQKRIGTVRDALDGFADRAAETCTLNGISHALDKLAMQAQGLEQRTRACRNRSLSERLAALEFRVREGAATYGGYRAKVLGLTASGARALCVIEVQVGMTCGIPRTKTQDVMVDVADLIELE